jgi:hypothetical protein
MDILQLTGVIAILFSLVVIGLLVFHDSDGRRQ